MLVSKAGELWRWDGLVAAADAPSAAAQRLAQKNRLTELSAEIEERRRDHGRLKTEIGELSAGLDAARRLDRERREAWRRAQHAIAAAQGEVDRAQKAIGD